MNKILFWDNEDGTLTLKVELVSEDETAWFHETLHPGESIFGITFEQFIADGTGEMEIN